MYSPREDTRAFRPRSWAEYYETRSPSLDSPLPLLLSWPLTVLHALCLEGLVAAQRPISIHCLGPEKEVAAEGTA